ncbi:pilin [Plesiomonas shigelloides]|uniref:pilin n=1 Tax=Plesiomonas shigelloides TaxID=703 RepID=UPI0015B3C44C|nr:pilin [Plesiomonas shigelloides]
MKAVNKGFTLIELMIVVAIIGVLAAVAIPAYQNYVGKAQFSAGLSQIAALKTGADMYIHEHGKLPDAASQIGAPVAYDNGTLTLNASHMTFQFTKGTKGIANQSIRLTKDANNAWACTTNATLDFVTGCTTGTIN